MRRLTGQAWEADFAAGYFFGTLLGAGMVMLSTSWATAAFVACGAFLYLVWTVIRVRRANQRRQVYRLNDVKWKSVLENRKRDGV